MQGMKFIKCILITNILAMIDIIDYFPFSLLTHFCLTLYFFFFFFFWEGMADHDIRLESRIQRFCFRNETSSFAQTSFTKTESKRNWINVIFSRRKREREREGGREGEKNDIQANWAVQVHRLTLSDPNLFDRITNSTLWLFFDIPEPRVSVSYFLF